MKLNQFLAAAALVAFAFAAHPAEHEIYPAPERARADIAAGLKTAAAQHKRVILDFGGNWCGDCQVLDMYFHNQQNLPILDANFVLVHVNIGLDQIDTNLDIANKYGVPAKRGVPALAVLSADGRVIYSQKSGEFDSMRSMQPSSVTEFLARWRPQRPGCPVTAVHC
jgi:thioredoxin 1